MLVPMTQGLARPDYVAIGGRAPWQRHMVGQRPEHEELRKADEPITENDIMVFRDQIGGALELAIRRRFQLTRGELSDLFKPEKQRKKKDVKPEYYAFLEQFRDAHCVPAMRDFASKLFPTMRAALLKRLGEQGITLVTKQ